MKVEFEVRKNEYGAYYIRHGDKSYILKVDNSGQLIISAGGNAIVIKPLGGNCVIIESER